jgi:PAS domain S-box-containing protein
MKQRKKDGMGFFSTKPDGKLIDSASLYANREWPCLMAMVIEQSTEGVAVSDLEGNIQYINKAFATIYGYNPKKLIDKNLSIFHIPDQLSAVREANEQIKKTGFFTGEIWHSRKDGSVFPTLMQNTLLKDEKGRAVGIIAMIRDISDLKQAQKELSEYRNQLEKMVKKKTRDLQKANKKLQQQMKEKEITEKELQKFSAMLEEQKASVERKNIALQEVLEQLHREKDQIKKDVMANVENLLIPVMQRMKIGSSKEGRRNFEIFERELKNLTSSFGRSVSDKKLRLTPREIEICDMIRNGLTSKEISRILGLSKKSVDGHRNRIRNKLGIRNKKYNLTSVLQHL